MSIRPLFGHPRLCSSSNSKLAIPTGSIAGLSYVFEHVLNESRVYLKASRNTSTNSFKSLGTTDTKWSQLAGLSLSQVSEILVVCLPMTAVELYNSAPYLSQPMKDTEEGRIGPCFGKRTLGYPYLARTISSCSSSAAADFILSFKKDEVLEPSYVFGKWWWHARRGNGETGIVHSKYLEFLVTSGQPLQTRRYEHSPKPRIMTYPYHVKALCIVFLPGGRYRWQRIIPRKGRSIRGLESVSMVVAG
jgi:hypothetical protein